MAVVRELPQRRRLTEDEVEYIASVIPSGRFPTAEDYQRALELRRKIALPGMEGMDWGDIEFCEVWMTSFDDTRETYLNELREHVRAQAREVTIIPTEIEALRNAVRRNQDLSHISPGHTVGILAAEAMGGPVQQMVLNTFHNSGSSQNVQGGVGNIRRLIYLSANNPNPMSTVHFLRPPTYLEAIRKEADLVGVTISMLMRNSEGDLLPVSAISRPWWYDLWEAVEGPIPPHNAYILRLTLDVDLLYQYAVNIRDVVNALHSVNQVDVIRCVYSPLHVGIIDVYTLRSGIDALTSDTAPQEAAEPATGGDDEADDATPSAADLRAVLAPVATPSGLGVGGEAGCECTAVDPREDAQNNAALTLLYSSIGPFIRKHTIKGINGIQSLIPVAHPVWSLVETETHLSGGRWRLDLSPYRERVTGITRAMLENLLRLCGVEVVESMPSRLIVFNNERGDPSKWIGEFTSAYRGGPIDDALDVPRSADVNQPWTAPSQSVQSRLRFDKWKYQRALDLAAREKGGGGGVPPRARFTRLDASEYIVVETTGSNLRSMIMRDDVDIYRTVSNDVREILSLFGIGAARAYLIGEFQKAIQASGSYVLPRHITLIVDFQTSRGVLLSVTYSALAKRNTHTLALATNQRGMEVLKNAAAIGKREAVRGPSAQILTNRRGNYGTGSMMVIPDREKLEARARELEAEKQAERDRQRKADDVISVDEVLASLGISAPGAPSTYQDADRGVQEEEEYDSDLIFGPGPAPTPSDALIESLPNIGPTGSTISGASPARVLSMERGARILAEQPPDDLRPELPVLVDPKIAKFAREIRVHPIAVGDEPEPPTTRLVPEDPLEAAGLAPPSPTVSTPARRRRAARRALPELGDAASLAGGAGAAGENLGAFFANNPTDAATTQRMVEETGV